MVSKKDTTLKEVLDKLDENQKILKDIAKWARFQNISKLKEVLEEELNTDEKKVAFENTEGENSLKEVAEMAKTPQDTVYGWWKKWFILGILEPSETRKGRLRKICSLEDVGIKVPKAVSTKQKEEAPEEVKTETTSEVVEGDQP